MKEFKDVESVNKWMRETMSKLHTTRLVRIKNAAKSLNIDLRLIKLRDNFADFDLHHGGTHFQKTFLQSIQNVKAAYPDMNNVEVASLLRKQIFELKTIDMDDVVEKAKEDIFFQELPILRDV